MRLFHAPLALIPLLLAGPPAAARVPDAPVRFDAIRFFAGHTEGAGRLKIVMRPPTLVDVHGDGRVMEDGTLLLRQTVEQWGVPAKQREWRIRQVTPGHYAGTLSDAAGPVVGEVIGGRLKLAFRMKGGLHATQWIEAAADGRSAHNRMTVRKMGVVVAHLDETIRRTGG